MMNQSKTFYKVSSIFRLAVIVGIAIIIGYILGYSIYEEKRKTVILILIILPGLLILPTIISKYKISGLLIASFSIYWLPIPVFISKYSVFYNLYLFELTIWGIVFFCLMQGNGFENNHNRERIIELPYRSFALLIIGALITYFLSHHRTSVDLSLIRVIFIFPAFIFPAVYLSIRSMKQIEKMIWVIMISTSLFALLFLLGQRFFGFVQSTEYLAGSGRFSMMLEVPYLGDIIMNPSDAEKFAFILPFGFLFWLKNKSLPARLIAGLCCITYVLPMLFAQARGGLIGCMIAVILISLYVFLTDKKKRPLLLGKLGIFLVIAIGGFWTLIQKTEYAGFYEHGASVFYDPLRDFNLIGRAKVWEDGYYEALSNPFGVGFFGSSNEISGNIVYTHNIFLFVALAAGIVGLIGFISIIYVLLKMFLAGLHGKHSNILDFSIVGIASVFMLIVIGFFAPVVLQPYSAIMVWAPLAICFTAVKLSEAEQKEDLG